MSARLTAVVGAQWGDEGKGKLVDILAAKSQWCVRYNGGSNAGHTVVVGDRTYDFHLIPCGILHPHVKCLLGNGTVIHLPTLMKELDVLKQKGVPYEGRLFISDRAHLVLDEHQELDGNTEKGLGENKIGTTKRGIGPCYAAKMNRIGLRIGDLKDMHTFSEKYRRLRNSLPEGISTRCDLNKYSQYALELESCIVDGIECIHGAVDSKEKILFEGANATMLDIDFGTYPYVTSSSPGVNGIPSGTGISILQLKDMNIIGIVKAYTTRVGEGPFPTELLDETGKQLRKVGNEFGTTTGRPRRCGWLDLVVVSYTHRLNGYSSINLTKLDVLSFLDEIKIGVKYIYRGRELKSFPGDLKVLDQVEVIYETLPGWKEDLTKLNIKTFSDLPKNAQAYVKRIKEILGVAISSVGYGPDREHILYLS